MYKEELLKRLKGEGKLVFTTAEISNMVHLRGPPLSNLIKSMEAQGHIGKIIRGRYYFRQAQVNDIFAIASKIVSPSYVGVESAFERFGVSNVIPKVVRVITTTAHRPIKTSEGAITFIHFKRGRFFGYNESRWVSLSSLEKAFVDSLYLGEFPFFTDLVAYHDRLGSYGYALDYGKMVDYTIRMGSRSLANRVGFFLDQVGMGDRAERLIRHTYRSGAVWIDRSKQSTFRNRKWMIR